MVPEDDKRSTRFELDKLSYQKTSRVPDYVKHSADRPPPARVLQKSPKSQRGLAPLQRQGSRTLEGAPKALNLPRIVESGGVGPIVKCYSPWDTYKAVFQCDLAGQVIVCEPRHEGSKVVAMRVCTEANGENLLEKYRRLHHINIISASECFKHAKKIHFLVDDLPITLEHLVACDAYPSEVQVASILKQVLSGMSYLLDKGYQHPSLKCSTILMGLDGVVKIANLEMTVPFVQGNSQSHLVGCLGFLAMELMQKYVKDNVGIDDTVRWPVGSNAFDFLSFTTSARSVKELSQHPLIAPSSSSSCLVGLARLAIVSACTFYSLESFT